MLTEQKENVPAPTERLWKVADVADFLGVSVRWVHLHVSQGDLPYTRIGGLLRFWPYAIRTYARRSEPKSGRVIALPER